MREIQRKIVSAIIFSKDGLLLMGKKDPSKGGVYPDQWHIPGGGVNADENLEEGVKREVKEETGIDITLYNLLPLPNIGHGSTEKTLDSGEKVLCHMEFNRFEIHIDDKVADQIKLQPSGDLIELRWFNKGDLQRVEQIPGGKEFFEERGYL